MTTGHVLWYLDRVVNDLITDDRKERDWFSTAMSGTDRSTLSGHLVLLSLVALYGTLVTSWSAV